jgi:PAS domain S-box-containing protein
MPDLIDDSSSERRWAEAWRRVVRATPSAVAVSELESSRFLEVSPRASTLFGATPDMLRGLHYLSFVEQRASAEQTFEMAKDGRLDFIRTRRRLRRVDGSAIDLPTLGWAIRSPTGPDLGLWMAEDGSAPNDIAESEFAGHAGRGAAAQQEVTGDLNEDWDISEFITQPDELIGSPSAALLGTPFHDLVVPADRARLLAALARATSGGDAVTHLRLRQRNRGWRIVRTTLRMPIHAPGVFSFRLGSIRGSSSDADRFRVVQLERSLQRIAAEVQAAGVLTELAGSDGAVAIRGIARLSARQWEVISHLLRGERVPAIAREMYVSQSTVRNHLAAIFRKFDVHSQQELIEELRRSESNASPV